MLIEQCGPLVVVSDVCQQARGDAGIRRQGVVGVPEVMEVQVRDAGRLHNVTPPRELIEAATAQRPPLIPVNIRELSPGLVYLLKASASRAPGGRARLCEPGIRPVPSRAIGHDDSSRHDLIHQMGGLPGDRQR